jgi:hypothetical protein
VDAEGSVRNLWRAPRALPLRSFPPFPTKALILAPSPFRAGLGVSKVWFAFEATVTVHDTSASGRRTPALLTPWRLGAASHTDPMLRSLSSWASPADIHFGDELSKGLLKSFRSRSVPTTSQQTSLTTPQQRQAAGPSYLRIAKRAATL